MDNVILENGYRSSIVQSPRDAELVLRPLVDMAGMHATHQSGMRKKPLKCTYEVEQNHFLLIANLEGCSMLRTTDRARMQVLSSNSVAVLGGGTKIEMLMSRGFQHQILFCWPRDRNRALADWWQEYAPNGRSTVGFIQCHKGAFHGQLLERVAQWEQEVRPNQVASKKNCLYLLVSESLSYEERNLLSQSASDDLAKPISRLVNLVRENPCAPWTLKEAARIAGYSAFHLSRTFKATVGYGFPEFVDRCRAELALQVISNPAHTMEVVATQSGFGSTQAMRDAFRDYTGFLPSEVRSFLVDQHALVQLDRLHL